MTLLEEIKALRDRYARKAEPMLLDEDFTTGSYGDDGEMLAWVDFVGDLDEILMRVE